MNNQCANKPNWTDAPEWANWLACDLDGIWYWYHDEPEVNEKIDDWDTPHGSVFEMCMWPDIEPVECTDWKMTLERRPSVID